MSSDRHDREEQSPLTAARRRGGPVRKKTLKIAKIKAASLKKKMKIYLTPAGSSSKNSLTFTVGTASWPIFNLRTDI